MEIFELSFVKIIKLDDDIAEVIVNEDVLYDLEMVHEYHDWLLSHMKLPCYILVNRINTHSYTFEAMRELGTLPEIKAIALVNYTRASEVAMTALRAMPKKRRWNSQSFTSRDEGLAWLKQERDRVNQGQH